MEGYRSSAGVCRKTSGFPAANPALSLSSGRVHRSNPVPELGSKNVNRLPSGVEDHGTLILLFWVKGCGLPAPSERVTDMPSVVRYTMYRPSGLHMGLPAVPVKV